MEWPKIGSWPYVSSPLQHQNTPSHKDSLLPAQKLYSYQKHPASLHASNTPPNK